MGQSQLQWRRDASTSPLIRWLWGLGLGTFIAAIGLIVFARLFALSGQSADGPLAMASLGGVVLAAFLVILVGQRTKRFEWDVAAPLEVLVGSVLMGAIIVGFARGIGGGVGHGLAALTIPIGLLTIGIASFLRSVGTLDIEEGALYLHDPDARVDLATISNVAFTPVSDSAIVRLSYHQPDGEYVPGPRRLVVPLPVAQELRAAQDSTTESSSSLVS